MNRSVKLIIIFMVLLLAGIISAGTAYAVWVQNAGEAKFLRYDIVDENPSLKYQIYVPINASGERISGTLNIIGRSYTLTDPLSISSVTGYALVGWDGGTAVTRLELPEDYTMEIDGVSRTFPAASVRVYEEFADYHFVENAVISEMEIPSNIIAIDAGAFSFMTQLSQLIFKGSGSIAIGDYAFASCPKLNTINRGVRVIVGDESKIFFRS